MNRKPRVSQGDSLGSHTLPPFWRRYPQPSLEWRMLGVVECCWMPGPPLKGILSHSSVCWFLLCLDYWGCLSPFVSTGVEHSSGCPLFWRVLSLILSYIKLLLSSALYCFKNKLWLCHLFGLLGWESQSLMNFYIQNGSESFQCTFYSDKFYS